MEKKLNLSEEDAGAIIPEEKVIGLLDNVARSIEELTPHLDHILSNEITAKQRQSFREHAGRARVFDLSKESYRFNERMNALCSEKARGIVFEKRRMKSMRG